jgi:hypothetical protein
LDKSTLEVKLKAVFYAMQDGSKTDAWMASQISAAVKEYALTGTAATVDAGAAPAGAYAGAGTGKMTIDSQDLEGALTSTFEGTKVNVFLAAGTANDIDAACSADDTVKTITAGTVTTPAGASSPFGGTGKGSFTGVKTTIEALLLQCFAVMDTMAAGGDDYLAAQLAAAVDGYLKAGVISVDLDTPLAGAGLGAVS